MWQQIQSRSHVEVPSNVNAMEEILQSIQAREIRLDTHEMKNYNQNFGHIVTTTLIDEMKKDEVFKALFKKISYSGSYYENLRVKTPDEFDLNVVIQLPKEFLPIQLLTNNVEPGFVRLKLTSVPPPPGNKVQSEIRKFLDPEHLLLRDKVLSWLQSVVDTALRNINWQMELLDPTIKVLRSTNGPAVTLNVTYGHNKKEFSVDLVPVFSFTNNHWPGPPIRKLPSNMDSRDLEWFVVPKSPRSGGCRQQWRMSFYMHEQKIMTNYANMKPTIKILKLLREKEVWKGLSSYYIKTIFLWEKSCKDDKFWKNSLSYIFYHMLCVLENCLAENYIPFFWHEKCNLLQHISSSTTVPWANRIGRIRKHIDGKLDKPEELKEYINNIFRRENQWQREDSETIVQVRQQQVNQRQLLREDSEPIVQAWQQRLNQQQHVREDNEPRVQARQQQQQGDAAHNLTTNVGYGAAIAVGIGIVAAGIAGLFAMQGNRRSQ